VRSINTISSDNQEKEDYYTNDESLGSGEDYYSKSETKSSVKKMTQAVWHGKGAYSLGLKGYAQQKDFKQVFYGYKPETKERIRGERPDKNTKERLAHDLTLSAPKSFSMAMHLGDVRLFDIHIESVKETLDLVETMYAQARVQVDGDRQVVNTGNLIAAIIPHHTSREMDMQLHSHCVIMNGTQCADGKWRALWHESIVDAEWLGSYYRQLLAQKVQELGYEIYETQLEQGHSFEIKGYTQEQIESFSKRSRQIVESLQSRGLEVNAENRDSAVLTTRKVKRIEETLEELQSRWHAEADAMGIDNLSPSHRAVEPLGHGSAAEELESAIQHLSERSISFSRKDIYEYVFDHIHTFDIKELNQAITQHKELVSLGERFTTVEAIERETKTVKAWMTGQGKAKPVMSEAAAMQSLQETKLNSGQATVVAKTLSAVDQHLVIHGLSGVGKTTAMRELKRLIEESGVDVRIRGYSPTIKAAKILQQSLGIETNTLASLVLKEPETISNQLWIVDEAGMVSARQMDLMVEKANAVGARILLVGDTKQNPSIEAGSPMRSLMEHGATTFRLSEIIRQESQIQKRVVELIADARATQALSLLVEHGYVETIPEREDRAQAVAEQWLSHSEEERNKTLIVTGTNAERLAITLALRKGLRAEGSLGEDHQFRQLVNRQLTTEEKRRCENYRKGDLIRLTRDYKSTPLKKDKFYQVVGTKDSQLLVETEGGRLFWFNPSQYKDKEVFGIQNIAIAVGDRLRWKVTNKELGQINGTEFTVKAINGKSFTVIDEDGREATVDGSTPLGVDYANVSTAYSAQGITAERVIVVATNNPTSAQEPFYVKISRQVKDLKVYVEDLEKLHEWVEKSVAQENPLELLEKNHEQRNISASNAFRYSRATQPDGAEAQRYGLQMQPDAIDYHGRLERLCGQINSAAIGEAIGGLRAVVEGLNRINQKLQQGNANRSQLARGIERLSESISNSNHSLDQDAEQRLVNAIHQRQIFESIQQPLLGLEDTFNQVKSIKPIDTEPLVELVNTLQQQINQLDLDTARTIQEEKLNLLAGAISQWRTERTASEAMRLQKIGKGINTLNVEQAATEVLKTQKVAQSINQLRAEDYIQAALQNFNQVLTQGVSLAQTNSQQFNALLNELQELIGEHYDKRSNFIRNDHQLDTERGRIESPNYSAYKGKQRLADAAKKANGYASCGSKADIERLHLPVHGSTKESEIGQDERVAQTAHRGNEQPLTQTGRFEHGTASGQGAGYGSLRGDDKRKEASSAQQTEIITPAVEESSVNKLLSTALADLAQLVQSANDEQLIRESGLDLQLAVLTQQIAALELESRQYQFEGLEEFAEALTQQESENNLAESLTLVNASLSQLTQQLTKTGKMQQLEAVDRAIREWRTEQSIAEAVLQSRFDEALDAVNLIDDMRPEMEQLVQAIQNWQFEADFSQAIGQVSEVVQKLEQSQPFDFGNLAELLNSVSEEQLLTDSGLDEKLAALTKQLDKFSVEVPIQFEGMSELVESLQSVEAESGFLDKGLIDQVTALTKQIERFSNKTQQYEFEGITEMAQMLSQQQQQSSLSNTLEETAELVFRLERQEAVSKLAETVHSFNAQQQCQDSSLLEQLQSLTERTLKLNKQLSNYKFKGMNELAEVIHERHVDQAIAEHLESLHPNIERMNELAHNHSQLQQLADTVRSLRSNQVSTDGAGAEQLQQLAEELRHKGLNTTPKPKKLEPFWTPVYTDEPPAGICSEHWQEFKRSAIHPQLIALNAKSLTGRSVLDRLLSDRMESMGSGQFVTQPMAKLINRYEQVAEGGWWGNAGVDARSLPTLQPGEKPALNSWGCFKPDNPRVDEQKTQHKGETQYIKYEHPVGVARSPYLPEVPDELAEKIYAKYGVEPTPSERASGFWYVVYQHKEIPITITEGWKKTLASLSQGEVTIGVSGVNALYLANDQEKNKLPQRQLNEELAVFATPRREFKFAFDQDTKVSTVMNVRRDMVRGIELLEARSCTCKVVKWDSQLGKGLDDLIANQGPLAYTRSQLSSVSSEGEKKAHYRTQYKLLMKTVVAEHQQLPQEYKDVEVYLLALQRGDGIDGDHFLSQSDYARTLDSSEQVRTYVDHIKALVPQYMQYKYVETEQARLNERALESSEKLLLKFGKKQQEQVSWTGGWYTFTKQGANIKVDCSQRQETILSLYNGNLQGSVIQRDVEKFEQVLKAIKEKQLIKQAEL